MRFLAHPVPQHGVDYTIRAPGDEAVTAFASVAERISRRKRATYTSVSTVVLVRLSSGAHQIERRSKPAASSERRRHRRARPALIQRGQHDDGTGASSGSAFCWRRNSQPSITGIIRSADDEVYRPSAGSRRSRPLDTDAAATLRWSASAIMSRRSSSSSTMRTDSRWPQMSSMRICTIHQCKNC